MHRTPQPPAAYLGPKHTPTPFSWWQLCVTIAGNLLPLYFILTTNQQSGYILLSYWLENLAIGLWTLPRILLARGIPPDEGGHSKSYSPNSLSFKAAKVFLAAFFCLHFGVFMAGHLGIIASIFPLANLPVESLALTLAGFFVTQGLVFYRTYRTSYHFRDLLPNEATVAPYGRITVIHFTLLFGGFIGWPLLLVLMKTFIDIFGYIKRSRFFNI